LKVKLNTSQTHHHKTWTYTYDSQGRLICISQNERKTETTYDVQGRTTSIKTDEGTVSYEYDKFGRQICVSSDKGDDIRYEYDIFGRLETVTDNANGNVTKYEYDLVGNLSRTTTKTQTNTLIVTYEYDNMNRLIKLTNYVDKNNNGKFDNGEGVSQFDYTLDNLGRKDYAIEKFWTEYGLQENEIDWEYDEAGRLVYEKFDHYDDEFDQTSEWIYDLVGNRLKQTVNGTIITYNYDVNDRLLNEVTDNKTTIYGYDHTQQTSKTISENGNIVSETTFEYDVQGRMSVVTIISGNKTEIIKYEYGTDGIRVSVEHEVYVDGELQSKIRTEYLNDSKSLTGYSQVLRQTEYDADGNIVKETSYVIGHQRISQTVIVNGEKTTHYFTFDGHGSTRVLLDAAIAIAQIFAFDAYGNAIGFAAGEALTEFLYCGEQFDSKIGQQYLRARYYDPVTGRFNRLDPFFGNLNDPQSFHKYLYTHADPINEIDPSGLFIGPVLARVAQLVMTVACVPAFQIAAGVLATHAIGYGIVQLGFDGNTNVEFIPDAALLGFSVTTNMAGKAIDLLLQGLALIPGSEILKFFLREFGEFAKNFGIGVAGLELVFNIASAQLSLTGFVGGGLGAEYFTGNAINTSGSVYTGLIWNLYNNHAYKGLGIYAELGIGNYSGTFFHSVSKDPTDKGYWGITVERNLRGGNKALTIAGGYIWAPPPLTVNYESSFYSIALASAWAATSTLLFGKPNLSVLGTTGILASY
jgi:RHS repeat-associated protein